MEQIIKTFHNYSDREINDYIAGMIEGGWYVKQFDNSTINLNGQIRICIVLLLERKDAGE